MFDKTISREELNAALGTVTLLEALPEIYFRKAHLPGALHFPHDQVDALAPRLLPDKEADIVVYCANDTCENSHVAAARLTQLGYERVRVYVGGKKDWEAAMLPVERGRAAA